MKSRFFRPKASKDMLAIDPRAIEIEFQLTEPKETETNNDIAIISICGPLEHHRSFFWDSYDSICERIENALKDDDVKSVILCVDSPGGDAAGATEAHRKIQDLKKKYKKRIYAYSNESMYSAAYSVGCAADEIWLPQTGGVGSVGVICTVVDKTRQNAANGLNVKLLTSGKFKADGQEDREITDEILERMQERVDYLADVFFGVVAKSRGMKPKEVAALEAGTFLGQQAVDCGLADGVAGWYSFLSYVGAQNQEALMGLKKKSASLARSRTRSSDDDEEVQCDGCGEEIDINHEIFVEEDGEFFCEKCMIELGISEQAMTNQKNKAMHTHGRVRSSDDEEEWMMQCVVCDDKFEVDDEDSVFIYSGDVYCIPCAVDRELCDEDGNELDDQGSNDFDNNGGQVKTRAELIKAKKDAATKLLAAKDKSERKKLLAAYEAATSELAKLQAKTKTRYVKKTEERETREIGEEEEEEEDPLEEEEDEPATDETDMSDDEEEEESEEDSTKSKTKAVNVGSFSQKQITRIVSAALNLTGVSDPSEIAGALEGMNSRLAKQDRLEKRVGMIEKKSKSDRVRSMLNDAKQAGKISPHQAQGLFEAGVRDPKWLKGYLGSLPAQVRSFENPMLPNFEAPSPGEGTHGLTPDQAKMAATAAGHAGMSLDDYLKKMKETTNKSNGTAAPFLGQNTNGAPNGRV